MDSETMMKTMRQAISNVLETMFFQPVQITDKNSTLQEWFSDKQSLLGAALKFTGPSEGSFFFIIPPKLAGKITANFLGLEEEEINEEQIEDTLKEALNMIGGHMLSLFDKEGEISLGIPELMEEETLRHDKSGEMEGDTLFIETEDNRLAAGIVMEMK